MNGKIPIFVCLCCLIAITGLSVNGQPKSADKKKVGGHSSIASFSSISKEEVEMLLADVAETNPMVLKRFAENPKMKKQQLEDLRQLLAFASQAQKEGLTNDPPNRQELENIRSEIIAVTYDRTINKGKGSMPPFGFITEERVKAFWSKAGNEAEFQKFFDAKLTLLKEGNLEMKNRETSEDERTQARDFFAKIEIYTKEYEDKLAAGVLTKAFRDKIDLQVKLQQAQFLARIYSDKAADKAKVTDEEVTKYIAEHPEFNTADKKALAEKILNRAKVGEDFAKLANEFSEDPGNKNAEGEPQGGLYLDVTKGKMLAPFEHAALALEPGQVAPNIVETYYGYHVIKLEKKSEGKNPIGQSTETYDVRHVLITTNFKDPADPESKEVPVKAYVRSKLETDKEKQVLDEIVASNNIRVPEDFTVPKVADQQTPNVGKKQPLRKKRSVKKRG